MDEDSLSGLIAIGILTFVSSLYSLAYAATTNAHLREAAEDGHPRARNIIDLAGSNQLIVMYQALLVVLHFTIAAITVLNVADPIVASNGEMPALPIYIIALGLVMFVALVVGMIVPEAVGSTYANTLAFVLYGMLRLTMQITSPFIAILLGVSRAVSSLFSSSRLTNVITEEEIMTLVDAGHTGGTIEIEEKDMIFSVLQLDETSVSEVMVPRPDVVAVEINQSLDEAAGLFIESGYSRIPVYEETIDHIAGLLYAKDLLKQWREGQPDTSNIRSLIRPAHFVSEEEYVDHLLKEIQKEKVHLAIVQDEYGGTAGLVTIEDIIEEIIGDIRDEYDVNEEAEYEQLASHEYNIDASIDLDDFNDLLDVDLPTEEIDTLGGYIYTHFGRVPVVGETIETDDLILDILSIDGLRIRKVHVLRKQDATQEGRDSDNGTSEGTTQEMTSANNG